MEYLIQIIQNYGYWAVFLGSLIEGESIILTASAMAALGYLNIYKIAIIAFCGTVFADQSLFLLGWYVGPSIFDKFPKIKAKAERASKLLHKYDVAFIIACRFVYGIRITSPIAIGAFGVSPARFMPLNILSAVIWTCVSCGGGYLLGDVMEAAFQKFELVQKYIFAIVGIIALLIFSFIFIKRWIKNRKTPSA